MTPPTLHRFTRVLARAVLCALALGAVALPAQAFFYEPFTDAAELRPHDELEQRVWDEADTLRSQWVRGRPGAALEAAQRAVRASVSRHWPELAPRLRVFVIDNADVLALSSANGDVILSTGMLMRLDSDEELQVILCREIAHVMQRHAVRSVHVARLGAGANVIFESAMNASSFMGTMGALASFQVTPDMLVAGGKALIQAQLGKLKDSMADSFVRSVSAGAFDAMVKSSLFGYSESLEREADDFALAAMRQRFGNVQGFERVAQRLLDEAQADEKKFSSFYANEERLARRLKAAQAHAQALSQASSQALAEAPSAPASQAEAQAPLQPQPQPQPQPAPDADEPSVAVVMVVATTSQSYLQAMAPLALRVLETELELGRLGRTMRNIERPRELAPLPPQAKAVLAEACVARADAASTDKGEALARELLALQPDNARMLKLLGLQALKRGQADDARQWLQRAREHAASDDERGFIDQYLRRAEKIAAAPKAP